MTTATTRHPEERELLQAAFRTFDEAAQTLQQSYSALTSPRGADGCGVGAEQRGASSAAVRQRSHARASGRNPRVLVHGGVGDGRRRDDQSQQSSRRGVTGATDAELRTRLRRTSWRCGSAPLCDRPQRIGQTVVSISQVPLHNDSGAHSGHLILFQDITRIYQLEEQLQRKERLAAMGELIGRIAHEIRNPWAASSSSHPCCSAMSMNTRPPNATPNRSRRPSS